ncbi:Leucine Rich repeats (2 copies) [Thalassoglobus neptunius]|uniref:Leucine Rich repeats (2 copies) n=1 Tax=Thalassoglobus neptunius TaxID=1938619 RepID=A0A5C5VX64_9PLAN|nr:hypothetical protein [Thalassoglobus neptunius]TWT43074.1 Leucine Rich repeats (2 copies) [Thalassoglobus neptunius]
MVSKYCLLASIALCLISDSAHTQELQLETDEGNIASHEDAVVVCYCGNAGWLVSQQNTNSCLRQLPQLDELILFDNVVTAPEIKYISTLNKLKSLTIGYSGSPVSLNGDFSPLLGLKNLETLEICVNNLSHQQLMTLEGMNSLECLWICPANNVFEVTDEFADCLMTFSKLEVLHIDYANSLTNDFVKRISSLQRLTHLDIASVRFSDRALELVATIPNLQSLRIRSPQFTNQGIHFLTESVTIESLDIDSNKVSKDILKSLAAMKQLKKIHLPINEMSAIDFKYVSELESLEVLSIPDAHFHDDALVVLSGHRSIRELIIDRADLTKESLQVFASLPNLEKVSIKSSQK